MSRTRLICVCVTLATSLYACSGATNIQPPTAGSLQNQPAANFSQVMSTSTQATTATTHFPTWAYDEYWGPGANASTTEVRDYISYAEGGLGNTKAVTDCSGSSACNSVFYVDPNFVYSSAACASKATQDVLSSATEAWYIHESGYHDSAHRVHGTYTMTCDGDSVSVPVDVLNDTNASVQAYFSSYLKTNADSWNYYFMDDTSGEVLTQMYGPGGGFCSNNAPNHYCTSTEELPTDETIVYDHAAFATAMNHVSGAPMQFFYNGLTFSDGAPSDLGVLSGSKHISGVVCEDCVVSSGTFRPTMYNEVLTAMADVNNVPTGQFVLISNGSSTSGSAAQIAQRFVTLAFGWLGYSPGHTAVFPNLEASSENLAAWPEENIVPSSPVQTMSSTPANIEVASGVYRREFASCTNAGVAIGPCAAFVNGTSAPVKVLSSWLHETYGHVISATGGDVTSGGALTITTAFSPNVTTIPADEALLIAR